jgi:hypothetical protein
VAAICCLSCHRRALQPRPYCSICGQRLLAGVAGGGPYSHELEGASRFLVLGPEVVQDRETGLFWQRRGAPKPLSHLQAPSYLEALNREAWGGRRDWRLPTLPELASLFTREKSAQGLYIDPVFDSRLPFCWSATESQSGGAFGVLFYPGSIQAQSRDMGAFVRGVAGRSSNLPEFRASPELLARGRKLLLSQGDRRVPRRAEVEGFLEDGGFFSEVTSLTGLPLYFLPTEEFLLNLIRLFRHLGVKRVLEVGAGEGFVAAALATRGFPVVTTDLEAAPGTPYGVPVYRASHLEAVTAFQPELVFWCWPPLNSKAPQELLQAPGCKYYLDVGDGGFATGTPGLVAGFRGRYLHTLSPLGYTRLDAGPFRHNRCFLFRKAF